MKSIVSAALLAVSATHVGAQDITDCDWRARADAIVEPWAEFSRTFANGNVRLALTDVVEPAVGAFRILVISPPYDEIGARQCKLVGFEGGLGFAGVTFEALDASYDPAVGLIFDVPVMTYNLETSGFDEWTLVFTLNQATGEIQSYLD